MPRNRQYIPRDQRVSTLLDVAARLFVENGYDNVAMADIARQAGVQSGALYWYFPSKEHVLVAVMDRANEARWKRLEDLSSMPAADRIVHYLLDMRSMRNLHVAMHSRLESSEIVRQSHSTAMHRLRALLGAALEGAPPELDRDLAVDALCAAFEGANIDPEPTRSGTEIVYFLLRQFVPQASEAKR